MCLSKIWIRRQVCVCWSTWAASEQHISIHNQGPRLNIDGAVWTETPMRNRVSADLNTILEVAQWKLGSKYIVVHWKYMCMHTKQARARKYYYPVCARRSKLSSRASAQKWSVPSQLLRIATSCFFFCLHSEEGFLLCAYQACCASCPIEADSAFFRGQHCAEGHSRLVEERPHDEVSYSGWLIWQR